MSQFLQSKCVIVLLTNLITDYKREKQYQLSVEPGQHLKGSESVSPIRDSGRHVPLDVKLRNIASESNDDETPENPQIARYIL